MQQSVTLVTFAKAFQLIEVRLTYSILVSNLGKLTKNKYLCKKKHKRTVPNNNSIGRTI